MPFEKGCREDYSPECVERVFSEVRMQQPAKTVRSCIDRLPENTLTVRGDHNI